MRLSRRVTLGSILIPIGFLMAHFVFDAIGQDDPRVIVAGLLFVLIVVALGFCFGLFRVRTSRLRKRQMRAENNLTAEGGKNGGGKLL